MTLTIEIPDAVANLVLSWPQMQRKESAIHAVINAWQTAANEEDEVWELTEDDIAAINEGIDDAEGRRVMSFEEVRARILVTYGSAESIVAAARSRLAKSDRNKRLEKLEAA